ncbi:uncharacterized protein A4U43_C04F9770 [Asparagus officinalis]|uniref:Secretory carrier-associated membrane protein n=1 Tax=Asparagus officinalis TaxID=4686 RepID=A0A5P1EZL2_ASPOF|nr:uncharacterized protein A4U43_C04F9770 [Asparagus officinalis]
MVLLAGEIELTIDEDDHAAGDDEDKKMREDASMSSEFGGFQSWFLNCLQGILLCLGWNIIAVIVCWIKEGGKLASPVVQQFQIVYWEEFYLKSVYAIYYYKGVKIFLLACIYALLGCPLSYILWYRPLYHAMRTDNAVKFGWFFPSWGILAATDTFSDHKDWFAFNILVETISKGLKQSLHVLPRARVKLTLGIFNSLLVGSVELCRPGLLESGALALSQTIAWVHTAYSSLQRLF